MSSITRWVIDPVHSSAEFRVPSFWGRVKVNGHFDRIDERDEHLRSADFFDTERHPDVEFVSHQVSDADDGRLNVQGELLAAGDRVVLELRPTLRQADDQIEIDASATVDQRQLGMASSPLGIARTPTVLTVHAHLRPQR